MDKDRLIEALRETGISQSELARKAGVTQGAINQIVNGRTSRSKFAPEIANALGVPLPWLLGIADRDGNIDQARLASTPAVEEPDYVQLVELDIGFGMGGGTFVSEHVEHNPRIFDPTWITEITRSPASMLFIARGLGDSMMPTLLDNDTLIVDRGQRTITQQDRIWAVTYGELGMIKRVRRMPSGQYMLMSDNPAISPIEAAPDEIHVVGRIVWIGRKA